MEAIEAEQNNPRYFSLQNNTGIDFWGKLIKKLKKTETRKCNKLALTIRQDFGLFCRCSKGYSKILCHYNFDKTASNATVCVKELHPTSSLGNAIQRHLYRTCGGGDGRRLAGL